MTNINETTFKIMSWIAVLFIIFLLAFSSACWALFYDAETERLSSKTAKNMRITSICFLTLCVLTLSTIFIWFLNSSRKKYITVEDIL